MSLKVAIQVASFAVTALDLLSQDSEIEDFLKRQIGMIAELSQKIDDIQQSLSNIEISIYELRAQILKVPDEVVRAVAEVDVAASAHRYQINLREYQLVMSDPKLTPQEKQKQVEEAFNPLIERVELAKDRLYQFEHYSVVPTMYTAMLVHLGSKVLIRSHKSDLIAELEAYKEYFKNQLGVLLSVLEGLSKKAIDSRQDVQDLNFSGICTVRTIETTVTGISMDDSFEPPVPERSYLTKYRGKKIVRAIHLFPISERNNPQVDGELAEKANELYGLNLIPIEELPITGSIHESFGGEFDGSWSWTSRYDSPRPPRKCDTITVKNGYLESGDYVNSLNHRVNEHNKQLIELITLRSLEVTTNRALRVIEVFLKLLSQTVSYEVKAGDTLSMIAQEFGVSIEAIVSLNNLESPDVIQVGQQLQIPSSE